MAMRVATFAISEQMIAAALRASTMANQQIQEASGVVSSDFAGYGSSTQQILNLQVSVTRSKSYIDAATQADSKIQVMYSTVGSVADLVTQLRSLLTSASNVASTDSTSVTQSAQNMLQQMASLLNTQYDGGYLFGGARTNQAPVDVSSSAYPALTSPSSADASYYQGDDQLASVRVSDTRPSAMASRRQSGLRAGVAGHEPGRQQFPAFDHDLERGAWSGNQRGGCRRRRTERDFECIIVDRAGECVPDRLSILCQHAWQRSDKRRCGRGHGAAVDLSGAVDGVIRGHRESAKPQSGELSALRGYQIRGARALVREA